MAVNENEALHFLGKPSLVRQSKKGRDVREEMVAVNRRRWPKQ